MEKKKRKEREKKEEREEGRKGNRTHVFTGVYILPNCVEVHRSHAVDTTTLPPKLQSIF